MARSEQAEDRGQALHLAHRDAVPDPYKGAELEVEQCDVSQHLHDTLTSQAAAIQVTSNCQPQQAFVIITLSA